MRAYFFLLGLLPFVNLYRFEPIPSFWVQWVTFLLATLFVVHVTWQRRRVQWQGLSVISTTLLALIACLLVQVHLGMVASRVNVVFAVFILTMGFLLHQVIRCQVPDDVRHGALRAWAIGISIAGLFQALAAIALWRGKAIVPSGLMDAVTPERAYGAFGQPNQFGVFSVLCAVAMLYLTRRRLLPQSLFAAAWLTFAIVCAASGSRAALLVWLLLVVVHLFDTLKGNRVLTWPKLTRGAGLWAMLAVFFLVQLLWAARGTWLPFFGVGVDGWESALVRADHFSTRSEQYRDAWLLFLERPFLGHGFEQFASARFQLLSGSMAEPQSTHTHNLITNALVEFGLVGGIPVVIGVLGIFWGSVQSLVASGSDDAESRLLAVWALGLLGYSMVEYPLNYTFFLYALLLVVAFLPLPTLRVDFRNWSIMPAGRWLFLVLSLIATVLVAVDFHRVQRMVLDLRRQVQEHGRVVHPPELSELTMLRRQSVFPKHVDFHWMTALGVDGDLSEQKIEVAKSLFEETPGGEHLASYVLQLVSGGQSDEAVKLLCKYGQRAKEEYSLALSRLREWSAHYPFLGEFMLVHREQLQLGCR